MTISSSVSNAALPSVVVLSRPASDFLLDDAHIFAKEKKPESKPYKIAIYITEKGSKPFMPVAEHFHYIKVETTKSIAYNE